MSGAFLRLTSADLLLQSCFLSVRNVSKFLSILNVNKFLLNQKDEFLVSSPVFAHRFSELPEVNRLPSLLKWDVPFLFLFFPDYKPPVLVTEAKAVIAVNHWDIS